MDRFQDRSRSCRGYRARASPDNPGVTYTTRMKSSASSLHDKTDVPADVSEIAGIGVHALGQYTFDDISCLGTASSPEISGAGRNDGR